MDLPIIKYMALTILYVIFTVLVINHGITNEKYALRTHIIPYKNDEENCFVTGEVGDQIFGTGFTFDNSVSVSFSGNNSNTFLSYSDWNQDGIIKGNSSYRRQTFRINNGVNLTDNITAKITVGYTRINASRIQQGSNLAGLYLGYLRTSPDFDNRDYIVSNEKERSPC